MLSEKAHDTLEGLSYPPSTFALLGIFENRRLKVNFQLVKLANLYLCWRLNFEILIIIVFFFWIYVSERGQILLLREVEGVNSNLNILERSPPVFVPSAIEANCKPKNIYDITVLSHKQIA